MCLSAQAVLLNICVMMHINVSLEKVERLTRVN